MKTQARLSWLLSITLLAPCAPCHGASASVQTRGERGDLPREERRGRNMKVPEVRKRGNAAAPKSTQDAFEAVFRELSITLPDIEEEVLECDEEVVRSSLPSIRKAYSNNGLSARRAEAAALTAWKEIRLYSPLPTEQCMVAPSYRAFTLSLGTLVFKSNPGDADIFINGKHIAVKTEHSRLFPAGKPVRVKYSKPGYEPAEIECRAKEMADTDCYAELRPIP